MIDTVIVTFSISPTYKKLWNWIGHPLIFPDGTSLPKYFQRVVMDNGAPLRFKYYPPNPPDYPLPRLEIQASLPRVLFGNNIPMITSETEIAEAIRQINRFLGGISWFPNLDFGSGILWRVDAVYNHPVGEYVQDYIRVLYKLDYPYRDTKPYPHQGVQFKSDVACSIFYDKRMESLSAFALGILRHEAQLRHTYYIERRMGIQNPTLKDVTIDWLAQVLQDDLRKLHLDDAVITDRSIAQWVLEKMYGWRMGDTLYAHLVTRQSMSKQQMIAAGKGERTIRRHEKLIVDAGLALITADEGLQLPPLKIQLPDGQECPVRLSDT